MAANIDSPNFNSKCIKTRVCRDLMPPVLDLETFCGSGEIEIRFAPNNGHSNGMFNR